MSRIAKGLALTSVAAAAVAGAAGAAAAAADSGATATADNSPGGLSGNVLEVPTHLPGSVCGDTIDAVGLMAPAFGSSCANT